MKARGYWEKDGTQHAWFGGAIPEGATLHEGAEVAPPQLGLDPRDKKIADLEAALAAMDARVKTIEDKEKAP